MKNKKEIDNNHPIIFTVDVEGDWAGTETRAVREVLPRLLEFLDRYSAKATFFVVGNLAPKIRYIIHPKGPHEVGSHGLTHAILTKLSLKEVYHEVNESKHILETEGYQVAGFRAPFFKSPPELPQLLAEAGYIYDASCGSVLPTFKIEKKDSTLWNTNPIIYKIKISKLSDGLTPFSLTYLRLYHPLGIKLISPRSQVFFCHLHEMLNGGGGFSKLPFMLRKIHARNSGLKAWHILEKLMKMPSYCFITCKEYLNTIHY